MTRLGIIGDIHLAVTPPGRRSESYLADVQAKLNEIAEAPDVDGWLLIGDVFHSKRADRIPHWLLVWVWDWLTAMTEPDFGTAPTPKRPLWIVPGNHDLADGSIESLARMPLTMLERHPNVHLARGVYNDPGFARVDGVSPYYAQEGWLGSSTDSATFMAVPGTGEVCDAKVDPEALFVHDVDFVFAHAPVDRQTRPWATYDAATLPLHPSTRAIIYGHQHDQAGAWLRDDGKLVIATGAISRGSVTEADHTPSWVLLDTNGTELGAPEAQGTYVEVRPIHCARPAAEVYRWAERTEEREHDATMTAFIESLGSEALTGFSREGLITAIKGRTDLAPDVVALATEILAADA